MLPFKFYNVHFPLSPVKAQSVKLKYGKTVPLKVLSNEMDPAQIRFIRLVVIKEWGAEIFRKIRLSPMLWEPFKVTAPSSTAVGYTVFRNELPTAGMKIHRAVGIGDIFVCFFKGTTELPHSLCRAANVFALFPTSVSHSLLSSQCRLDTVCTVLNVGKTLISQLLMSRSIHWVVSYSE